MTAFGDSRSALKPQRYPGGDEFATGVGGRVGATLRSGWKLILTLTLLGAVAAYAVSALAPVQYQTSARIFLDGRTLAANGADPVRQVLTESKLAVSGEAITLVSHQLGIPTATAEAHLSAEAAPNGNYFTVTGTSTTPAGAVALVKAAEQAYQTLASQQRQGGDTRLLDQLVSQRAAAQAAYDSARGEYTAKPGDYELQARVAVLAAQLRALSSAETEAFTVQSPTVGPVLLAERPQLPMSPSTPKPRRDSLLGGMFGFLLAAVALWWRSSRFPTAASADADRATGLVPIAELPQIARSALRRRRTDQVTQDGGFAGAALALDLAMPVDLKVLLLAPCRRGDLAPEVAAGLAGALACGRSVVLVDGNVGDRALTDALERLGAEPLEPPMRLASGPVALTAPEVLGEALLVTAQLPRGPAARQSYSHLIADLGTVMDLVVVVGPPPDASLPAALLAETADAAVIVARGDTPLGRVITTRDRLTSLGRPTLGLVLDRTIEAKGWRRTLGRLLPAVLRPPRRVASSAPRDKTLASGQSGDLSLG